jgi:hypothetical protein
MEETQGSVTQFIDFEQFKSIPWTLGLPCFIIELIGYLAGDKTQIQNLASSLKQNLSKAAELDFE